MEWVRKLHTGPRSFYVPPSDMTLTGEVESGGINEAFI